MSRARPPWAALAFALSFACSEPADIPSVEVVREDDVPKGLRPGGDLTVPLGPSPSFVRAPPVLDASEKARFYSGKALASQPWVRAPTLTDARDGLGPLYHARSCLACHVEGGRGQAADAEGNMLATLVRLSRPGEGPHGGPLPDPVYGGQLQPQSTSLRHQLREHPMADALGPGAVVAEAHPRVEWDVRSVVLGDGTPVELRAPELRLEQLGYGPLHPDTLPTLRHAPSLAGIGLLATIEAVDLERLADPEDRDGDGISGRINWVWDPEVEAMRPGRFGLKANQASVKTQVAAALHNDMGLSNPVFPGQPCTERQPECLAAPHGNDGDGLEVSAALLDTMVFFSMLVGVVERRRPGDPSVEKGGALFVRLGCDGCHVPHFKTGNDPGFPHLSGQDIWPYTDLLLHDMGPELADGRADFDASGKEWRTAPLWGVGLARAMHARVGFLHDGRARTVEEAILWHGGEAKESRERFAALGEDDRRALLSFVRSL